MLVATCGVMFWAARYLWENQHPAYRVALGLQAENPPRTHERDSPAGPCGYTGHRGCDPASDCRTVGPGARSPCRGVRTLAAVDVGEVKPGPSADADPRREHDLIGSLKDPKPDVRVAALKALAAIVSFTPSNGSIDLERVFVAASELLEVQDAEVRVAALGDARCSG